MNTYKNMMEEVVLSPSAKAEFVKKLACKKPRRFGKALRAAVVAACVGLIIPTAVFAADTVFDLGIVEFIREGYTYGGKEYDSLRMGAEEPTLRPITDFAEKWRYQDGYTEVEYKSWAAAEEDMGIHLANNLILEDPATEKLKSPVLRDSKRPVHCCVCYTGWDGYLGQVTAWAFYKLDGASIDLYANVAVEHPTSPKEDLTIEYGLPNVESCSTEAYTSPSGLTANITTVTGMGPGESFQRTKYFASFIADGIRYELNLSPYKTEDPEGLLKEILDAFVF